MNTMKYVMPFLLAIGITGQVSAQVHAQGSEQAGEQAGEQESVRGSKEYKVTVDNTKEGQLTLDDFPGDIPIEGYTGNQIVITVEQGEFDNPERAKGLRAIYSGGTDNTGIALYMEKNGNSVSFRCLLPITKDAKYHLKVPENIALRIHQGCARAGTATIANMKNEVDYDGCSEVNLKNVNGPLVISTINGGVNVVFSEISKDKPISIASINGDVDVTLPATAAVDLEMSNVNGNMYSDFDFTQQNKDMRRVGGNTIRATLNGGGTELKLHGVNGNVYLRKAGTK